MIVASRGCVKRIRIDFAVIRFIEKKYKALWVIAQGIEMQVIIWIIPTT